MIIYEVQSIVREDLCAAYEVFMTERHIPDLLATGHFETASFEVFSTGIYRVRYCAKSRESLDQYFAEQAPRLRADLLNHFPEGIDVSRSEWALIKHFA